MGILQVLGLPSPGGFGRAIDEIVKRGRPGAPAR